MAIPRDLFTRLVNEWQAKVDHGEIVWEPEAIDDDEPLIPNTIPDKLLDIPKPDSKMSGYAAQLPSAKVSRSHSNMRRSFFDD